MTLGWIERLILVGVLLACSGLFSGSETALFSLSRVKREAMGTRNDQRDRAVLRLLGHPRRLIVTLILCNELVNVGISTLMAGLGEHWIMRLGIVRPALVTILTAFVTVPLIVLVGDMTPKTLAIRSSEQWARVVARPLELMAYVVAPLREVLRLVAEGVLRVLGARLSTHQEDLKEEEFRALIDVGEKEGEVEGAERRLIHNVFEFGDRTVGEVMTPADRVFALPYEMPLRRMVDAIADSRYSRVPIYRKGTKGRSGEVVGILHAKDLVGYGYNHLEGHTIRELLKPPFFVPRAIKCDTLFREFQRRKTHLALVVDEYGRLAGLVTMEDLLEELFGEIVDEKEATNQTVLPPEPPEAREERTSQELPTSPSTAATGPEEPSKETV
ncbi:MAG TPA: hemolysin family protein [Polyangia bacterium]|jgi:putative hemolysin|nr:hemolysin family protein [Polyangia bacterium]